MASAGTVVIEVDANIAKLVDGMKKSSAQISNLQKTANSATKTLSNFAKAATTLFVGAQFLSITKDVIGLTDTYKQMTGQLGLVTNTTEELTTAQKSLFDISQRTRQGFEQTSKLFVSFSSSMKQMGKSQKEILGVTETVNQAIALSGSTAQESAAALLQLGQAFGSGKLAGDELKSIMENAKGLSMAIADGMDVPIGKLKEMGAAGTITSEVLFKALEKMAESIDTRFATLPVTVAQSIVRIKNSLLDLAGGAEAVFGVGGSLSVAFSSLSSSITANKDAIISFLGVVKEMITQAAILAVAWKVQALVIAPVIAKFKAMEFGATTLMGKYIALRFGLVALGRALKAFAMSNLPFIALTVAFEAWNYVTNQSAEAQEKLKKALALTSDEVVKLTKVQQLDNLNNLKTALFDHRQITQELRTQLTIAGHKLDRKGEEYIAIRANFDAHVAVQRELQGQIGSINAVIDGTYSANKQAEDLAGSAKKVAEETIKAAEAAYKLSSALGNAVLGMETTLIKAQEIAGKISETSAVKQIAGLGLENVRNDIAEVNKMYSAVGANREELDVQLYALANKEMELHNGLATQLKSISDKKTSEAEAAAKKIASANKSAAKSAASAGKAAAKAGKDAAKALEQAAQEADSLNRKFLELTGNKEAIFQLDVDKQLKELIASGKYTAEQIGQAYDGMYKDYVENGKDANDEIAKHFTDSMRGGFDALFNGDLKGMIDGFFGDAITGFTDKISASMSESSGGGSEGGMLAGIASGFTGAAIGLGIAAISELMTTVVTQQEIDASIGRVEFDDDSLKNLEGVFADAQYPMLEVTNKMYGHLRNMDANFFSIARAMSAEASAGGVDLTGANFVDTESSTFLGFSSKSLSLIGTGLNFQLQNLNDMMDESALHVSAYTTTLSTKTSLFGLRSKQKILESMSRLPPEVASDLAEGFANGFEMIMTAGVSLGLNEANLEQALLSTKIAIGKIDFTGLSDDEVANRLSQAYSTYFSEVIGGVDDLSILTDRYAVATEEAMETLGRIAVEYDQGKHSLGLIGKNFKEGVTDVVRTWTETTMVMQQAPMGWKLKSGTMPMIAVATEMSEIVKTVYTAQMQILDIVESAGGLTNFQDAMGAFVSGFYTETEQLDFMTKSMSESFNTLNNIDDGIDISMPDLNGTKEEVNARFRALLETGIDTSTEAGSYLYGQVLLLAEGFNQMTDSADSLAASIQAVTDASNENIKTYLDSFKDSQELASDMASGLGVSLATTDEGLTALFEKLKGGVDGLTDSELQFLMANKGVIEEAANKAKLASEEAAKTAADLAEATAKSVTDMIKSISDAWLGNLSYLTMKQKADYASGYLSIASSSNGAIDTVEAARLAAETALKSSSTQEEFIPIFDRYIQELEKKAPEATTDDVVIQLKILAEKLDKLEATTRQTA